MLLQIVLITALHVLQIVLQWITTEGGDLHHLQECKNARSPGKSRMHLAPEDRKIARGLLNSSSGHTPARKIGRFY